ncbi:hypothetical protein ZWY2020_051721 [Hordeum vulgare]|nr:hypothetical protein ZWY2020_051721 [Hordeum vulgare]
MAEPPPARHKAVPPPAHATTLFCLRLPQDRWLRAFGLPPHARRVAPPPPLAPVEEVEEALEKLGFYLGKEDTEFSSFSTGTEQAVKTCTALHFLFAVIDRDYGGRLDDIEAARDAIHRTDRGGSQKGKFINFKPE